MISEEIESQVLKLLSYYDLPSKAFPKILAVFIELHLLFTAIQKEICQNTNFQRCSVDMISGEALKTRNSWRTQKCKCPLFSSIV